MGHWNGTLSAVAFTCHTTFSAVPALSLTTASHGECAAEATCGCQGKRQCLGYEGGGNTRQRQGLTEEKSPIELSHPAPYSPSRVQKPRAACPRAGRDQRVAIENRAEAVQPPGSRTHVFVAGVAVGVGPAVGIVRAVFENM